MLDSTWIGTSPHEGTMLSVASENFDLENLPLPIIHGSGSLALGLLAERSHRAGRPAIILSRRRSSRLEISARLAADCEFDITHSLNSGEFSSVTIGEVIYYDEPSGRERLDALLCEEPNILYMTAVRTGQDSVIPIVRSAVEARRSRGIAGIFILAPCENAVSPSLSKLASALAGPGFAYLDMMVDRICPQVDISGHDRVLALADDSSEWAGEIISSSDELLQARIREMLAHFDLNVVHDIEPVKKRKQWLMNGVQTCMAIFARSDGYELLREYHEAYPELLESLSYTYGEALRYWAADHGEPYAKGEIEAWRQSWYEPRIRQSLYMANGEPTIRILTKYRPSTRGDQLKDISSKLSDAHDALYGGIGPKAEEGFIFKAMQIALDLKKSS